MRACALFVLLLCASTVAAAQTDIPPTGTAYQVGFNAFSGTAEVCAFAVTPAGVGIDRLPPTGFDKADSYACTTAVVADGTTKNTLAITITPLPPSDILIALIAYPAAGSTKPPSAFSNQGLLLAKLKAPVIVP